MYTTLCDPWVKSLNLSETVKLGALVRDPPGLKSMIPQCVACVKSLQLCPALCDLWTVACQISLSMGFSRQEHWDGLPCTPLGDLPDQGIEAISPVSLALQADSLLAERSGKPMY